MALYQLVYASSATHLFSAPELEQLLVVSRANNTRLGVSGMLLYKDGNFMQALEGEREAVRQLFDKISRDPRHRGVLVLANGEIATRQFADWSMAFRNLDALDARGVPGYSEFLDTPLTDARFTGAPSLCHRLLQMFKANMR